MAKRTVYSYKKDEITNLTMASVPRNIEEFVYLSKVRYETEETPYNYTECKICTARFAQVSAQHFVKYHPEITCEEYQKKYNVKTLKCQAQCDRVKGDNNPGANHGGRLSKFSNKFIKYDGMSKQEIEKNKKDVANKSKQTKRENPQNENTKIEYYLAQGLSELEAKKALSARQSTFSLEKCIKKHGEEMGHMVWYSRQTEWQKSLTSKSQEEIERINRDKSPKYNYANLWNGLDNGSGIFYVIKIADNMYKYGISSAKTLKGRFSTLSPSKYEEIYLKEFPQGGTSFKLEKVVSVITKDNIINKADAIYPFGWTETLKLDESELDRFLMKVDMLANDEDKINKAYDKFIIEPIKEIKSF